MPHEMAALFERARAALRTTQEELGAMLGVSRRTAQRWASSGVPSYYLTELARAVHPHDVSLAREIAAAAGTTLRDAGIEAPAPAPAPSAPPAPAPAPAPPVATVDAVVCAAAEAMDLMPREVRPALLAAFASAREIGLTVEMVERALRAKLAPPAPVPSADAPAAKPKGAKK